MKPYAHGILAIALLSVTVLAEPVPPSPPIVHELPALKKIVARYPLAPKRTEVDFWFGPGYQPARGQIFLKVKLPAGVFKSGYEHDPSAWVDRRTETHLNGKEWEFKETGDSFERLTVATLDPARKQLDLNVHVRLRPKGREADQNEVLEIKGTARVRGRQFQELMRILEASPEYQALRQSGEVAPEFRGIDLEETTSIDMPGFMGVARGLDLKTFKGDALSFFFRDERGSLTLSIPVDRFAEGYLHEAGSFGRVTAIYLRRSWGFVPDNNRCREKVQVLQYRPEEKRLVLHVDAMMRKVPASTTRARYLHVKGRVVLEGPNFDKFAQALAGERPD